MTFGKRVKRARESNNLTKARMAELLGMSERMISYYESGDFKGDNSRIEKYMKKLSEIELGNFHEDVRNMASPEEYKRVQGISSEANLILQEKYQELSDEFMKTHRALLRSHKIFQDIVEQGVRNGSVVFEKKG